MKKCSTCQGTRTIYRPLTPLETFITDYEWDHSEQEYIEIVTPTETIIGGIDACPECTANAEVQYTDLPR